MRVIAGEAKSCADCTKGVSEAHPLITGKKLEFPLRVPRLLGAIGQLRVPAAACAASLGRMSQYRSVEGTYKAAF